MPGDPTERTAEETGAETRAETGDSRTVAAGRILPLVAGTMVTGLGALVSATAAPLAGLAVPGGVIVAVAACHPLRASR